MFGYVRIDKPEMKVREYETYRSVYCGLCRAMGRCTGCSSRMTLSYDFAFLLLFRTVLARERMTYTERRCLAHPTRKKPMIDATDETDYVACAAALLTYYKCRDDLMDESGGRRMLVRSLYPTAKRMRRKALRRFPELCRLDECIADAMDVIALEEKKCHPSADFYAELSGGMLGAIFSFGLGKTEERIARVIGKHIGKWIYLIDAFEDLDEDREKGRFNPFLLTHPESESEEERKKLVEIVRVALLNELAETEKAVDLVDFSGYEDVREILFNILYLGMPKTAERILSVGAEISCDAERDGEEGEV